MRETNGLFSIPRVVFCLLLAAPIIAMALMPTAGFADPAADAKTAQDAAQKAETAAGKAEKAAQSVDAAIKDAAEAAAKSKLADPKLDFSYVLPVLGKLFVAAVILESAFAVVFKSRIYQEFFNGRGLTVPILIVVAWFVTKTFGLDGLLGGLFWGFTHNAQDPKPIRDPDFWSTLLTALTLAGGSAGVNSMLQAFGYRVPPPPPTAKPDETHAWISVQAVNTFGRPVAAKISIVDAGALQATDLPITGTTGAQSFLVRLRHLMFPDQLRFPRYGGHTVDANKRYTVTAFPVDPALSKAEETFAFGSRAIVDLTLRCADKDPS